MLSASDLAMLCQNAREQGDGWQCCCPAHDDTHASLSIHDGEKGVVLHCHAGCEFSAILAALGLAAKDLFTAEHSHASTGNGAPSIVATYDYTDAYGTLLYQSVRYFPKDFSQRRPHPTIPGKWIGKLGSVPRVLYRLPEVLAAERVLAVEGEADVENLRKLGYVATTASGGARATTWSKNYIAMWYEGLRGKDVVLLPDNDDTGLAHMAQAAKHLHGVARSVRVLLLPGLPEKGDVSDWLKAGHTAEQLAALIDGAPPATDTPRKPHALESHAHQDAIMGGAEESGVSIEKLATYWGIPITAVICHGDENSQWSLCLDDGREIFLGTTKNLLDQRHVRAVILERTKHLIPRISKQEDHIWDQIIQALVTMSTTVANPDSTRIAQGNELLGLYLRSQSGNFEQDFDEGEWEEMALSNRPFRRDGGIYVHARTWWNSCIRALAPEITYQDTLGLLRLVGATSERITLHKIAHTDRSYWRLPVSFLERTTTDDA